MTRVIRLYLVFEAAAFALAALIHAGFLAPGNEHREARIAETVIALVLALGWAISWLRPQSTPGVGLAAQAFALLGTLVGIVTIVIGVGPRTVPDVAYHVTIVVVLVLGLRTALHARNDARRVV